MKLRRDRVGPRVTVIFGALIVGMGIAAPGRDAPAAAMVHAIGRECPAAPAISTPTVGAPTQIGTPSSGFIVKGDGYEGVIFSDSSFSMWLLGVEPEAAWMPSAAEVARFEAGLPTFLCRTADSRSPELWSKLTDYRRQYVGVVIEGNRMLLVNYFGDDGGRDWRSTPILVDDGGDCSFSLTYSIGDGTYDNLMINGNA